MTMSDDPAPIRESAGWWRVRWAYPVVGLLIGLSFGWIVGQSRPALYDTTAQLLVGPIGADRSTLDTAGLLSRTYADLLTSRSAVERAAEATGITADDVTVTAIPDERSRTIRLVVESSDVDVPPALSRALIDELLVTVNGAEGVDASTSQPATSEPGQLRVLDPPKEPATERHSLPLLVLVGASLVGLIIGWWLSRLSGRGGSYSDGAQESEAYGLRVVPVGLAAASAAGGVDDATFRSRQADVDDLALVSVLIQCHRGGAFTTVLLAGGEDESDTVEVGRRFVAAGRRIGQRVVIAAADAQRRDVIASGLGDQDVVDIEGGFDESGMSRVRALAKACPQDAIMMIVAESGIERARLTAVAAASDRVVLVTRPRSRQREMVEKVVAQLRSVDARLVALVEVDDAEDGGGSAESAPVAQGVDEQQGGRHPKKRNEVGVVRVEVSER